VNAIGSNAVLPMLTAAMVVGPSDPTMSVSTTPMNIHPSSATMTGHASRTMSRSVARIDASSRAPVR
jgi:hypothetical protein